MKASATYIPQVRECELGSGPSLLKIPVDASSPSEAVVKTPLPISSLPARSSALCAPEGLRGRADTPWAPSVHKSVKDFDLLIVVICNSTFHNQIMVG